MKATPQWRRRLQDACAARLAQVVTTATIRANRPGSERAGARLERTPRAARPTAPPSTIRPVPKPRRDAVSFNLTYPEALGALRIVAERIAEKTGKDPGELQSELVALADEQNVQLPAAATSSPQNWGEEGPRFIEILRALLGSGDDFLSGATQTAILEVKGKGEAHALGIGLIIAVGAVVFAIGLLSKVSYDSKEGFHIKPGFPELEKIPAVIKSFLGIPGK